MVLSFWLKSNKSKCFFSIYFCLSTSLGLKIFAPFSESNLNGNGICAATATKKMLLISAGLAQGFYEGLLTEGLTSQEDSKSK